MVVMACGSHPANIYLDHPGRACVIGKTQAKLTQRRQLSLQRRKDDSREESEMTVQVAQEPDFVFQVTASGLDKLFEDAAISLTELVVDRNTVLKKETKQYEFVSTCLDDLMHVWLSEITYLFDCQEFLPAEVAVKILHDQRGGLRLSARISGEHFDKERHQIKNRVKSILVKEHKPIKNENGTWLMHVHASGI